MLTRHLHLKLLAPTVLVSLALVAACLLGVHYVNSLHTDISADLQEAVESMQAAARLETTTTTLITLFRSKEPPDRPGLVEQVEALNASAHQLVESVQSLANREREKEEAPELAKGLDDYLQGWEQRSQLTSDKLQQHDLYLAELLQKNVLPHCINLRHFNTDEIQATERSNRTIVSRLTWSMLAVALGAPLAGLLLGYAVARGLHHSIYQLSVHLRDAAGLLNREFGSGNSPEMPGGDRRLVITVDESTDLPDLHKQMRGVLAEVEHVVEQLQQREREVLRAEQLAAVGQVAAGVAHELRNPLTSVKMLVQTGLEGAAPRGLPPEDLSIIEHEVRRMELCIQTFLDLARPPHSERRRTDLRSVLQRALLLIEGRARRQRVTLEADPGTDPLFLEIDPEQIHQVLVNLLLNALDALPRGGKIAVSVGRCFVGTGQAAAAGVEVRIQDNGPGIAARIRERLFQPFVSSKETGLGLGLSICKRLIEAHGGTIRGENLRGGGALFAFTLPG